MLSSFIIRKNVKVLKLTEIIYIQVKVILLRFLQEPSVWISSSGRQVVKCFEKLIELKHPF